LKVFISWSGSLSNRVSAHLVEFLGLVIQSLEIFISTEIERGSIWNNLINNELRNTFCGIICITSDNFEAPWILFESGALAKGIEQNRICTFLIDLDPSFLLSSPLAQFNHTFPTRDSMFELVKTLNNHIDTPLDVKRLEASFDMFWPKFIESFQAELKTVIPNKKPKSYKELATESLDAINRVNAQLSDESSVGSRIRKIEYRVAKLYDLEFDKRTASTSMNFIHRVPNDSDQTMSLWLYYKDDFEDNAPLVANEILKGLSASLKDDFARYECNWFDDYSQENEPAIKYTFIRDDKITADEYNSITKSLLVVYRKYKMNGGGIRCTGARIL
jgi:hypothetical protein